MAAAKSRPKTGPGSRTRVNEPINDEIDAVIFSMFPKEALEMCRDDFKAWKKENDVPPLSKPEQERLNKHRRTMMARRYARESRKRNIDVVSTLQSEVDGLTRENKKLRTENKRLRGEIQRLRASPSQQLAKDEYLSDLSSSGE